MREPDVVKATDFPTEMARLRNCIRRMRAVLRAGAYELKKRKDIPVRVVITEYVSSFQAKLRKNAGLLCCTC